MKSLLILFSIVIFSCGKPKENINQLVQKKMSTELTNKYPNMASLKSIKFEEIKEGENVGEITIWDNRNYEYVYSSKISYKGEDDFTWEVIERKTPAVVFDLMKDFDGSKYITPVDLAEDKKISGDIKIMGGLTVHRGDMFMINDFTDSRIYNKVDEKSFTTEEKKKIINNCKGGCAIVCEAKIVGKYGGDAVLKISKINSIDLLLK